MNKPANVAALSELREMNGKKLLTAKDVPLRPILWRLLVQPLPPRKTYGESKLEVTDEVQNAEEILTSVGRVVAMGSFVFKSKTNAGLNLADEPDKPTEGGYILFAQYAGQEIVLEDEQRTKLRIIDDTEILAIVSDPESIRRYL